MSKISVLFVCLGNICRSPTAHAVFQSMVDSEGLSQQITVDSAGTGDWHLGHAPDQRRHLDRDRVHAGYAAAGHPVPRYPCAERVRSIFSSTSLRNVPGANVIISNMCVFIKTGFLNLKIKSRFYFYNIIHNLNNSQFFVN